MGLERLIVEEPFDGRNGLLTEGTRAFVFEELAGASPATATMSTGHKHGFL